MASLIIHVLSVDEKPKEPAVTVFPPFSKDGTIMLVCLAEKYFPDVIKLEWKKNSQTVPEAMVQDEKVKATIMLKVNASTSFDPDHYSCHVTHESLKDVKKYSIPRKTAQLGPVTAPTCPPYTDDKKKETSSLPAFNVGTLAYTLLILKSVTYCGIISILTSKTKSTQVLGIKKRVP
ncbi:hypothetical protein HHUSO_G4419 [Huso huso]|uniref:Ig-like domain-containing protein n=1 Tax=Huso huso TaxID=61971 RepID=A0ABR1A4Y8_HUSHU